MSESLRNDGRIWVPKEVDDTRSPDQIPEDERDYFLERRYPAFGNLVPRDVASRAIEARGRRRPRRRAAEERRLPRLRRRDRGGSARDVIEERYGNLFQMYERITGEDPYVVPMRIYPAVHYTMGGLWVDYNLMSNVPGLYVLGEANFSDHGANRLGASALMQGLADGYFVLPATIGDYLAPLLGHDAGPDRRPRRSATAEAGRRRRRSGSCCRSTARARSTGSTASSARSCGTTAAWPAARRASTKALAEIPALREEFWTDVRVLGDDESLNQSLEKAGRVADFLEFGELIVPRRAAPRGELRRALPRVEHQTEEGEALRDDEHFAYVARVGVHRRRHASPTLHKEAARVRERPPRAADLQVSRIDGRAASMKVTLKVWRQAGPDAPGRVRDLRGRRASAPTCRSSSCSTCSTSSSIADGEEPIAFDHDCREGICGSCSMMINGRAHGPERGTATCQLHMRKFDDGAHDHGRAVAGGGVPDHQGPRRRPQRVRPHHRGRRLHHRAHRQRARRAT